MLATHLFGRNALDKIWACFRDYCCVFFLSTVYKAITLTELTLRFEILTGTKKLLIGPSPIFITSWIPELFRFMLGNSQHEQAIAILGLCGNRQPRSSIS